MELIEGIYYIFHGLILIMVMILWLSVSDDINKFIKVNETHNFGIPKVLITRRWSFHTWSLLTVIFTNIVAILEIIISRIIACLDIEDEKDPKCVFYFPAWFPFDVDNFYLRNYILFCRWMIPIYVANILAFYILVPVHLIVVSARIRHLDYLLKGIRLNRGIDLKIMNKKLRFCIKYHTEILG